MNKRLLFFCTLFSFIFCLNAQTPAKYWVQFKDKNGTPYSIERPREYLSQRAIDLRQKHNIAVVESDLPVNPQYVKQVLALDSTMRLFTSSKWLNGITVYCEKENILAEIQQLPCVQFAEVTIRMKEVEPEQQEPFRYSRTATHSDYTYASDITDHNIFDYGKSFDELKLNGVVWLHHYGFRGTGMRMMILDGGFLNVDTLHFFETLRNDNRLLGVRNLVQPEESPFIRHTHGSMVLSCIASYVPGELVGSAPMTEVYLCQTEDSRSENKIEEDNWVAGVELADSLGCQVLNSSLGYIKFDDSLMTRTYSDLNGQISRASQAATIAASKGMIICNSAGNSGDEPWRHLGCPADARNILTVGAVDVDGDKASFSSFGPTADGRIKPDACAVGYETWLGNTRGKVIRSFGTSFSSPLLAGMVTCLWQAFPDKSNYEIMEAIRQSGSQYAKPDSALGYGIPNFLTAYNILLQDTIPGISISFKSFVTNSKSAIEFTIAEAPEVTASYTTRTNDRITKPIKVSRKYKDGVATYCIKFPNKSKEVTVNTFDLELQINGQTLHYVIGQ